MPGDSSQFWQNLWPEKTFLRTEASWGELFRTCFQHNLLHIVPITYLMLKHKYAFTAGSSNWRTTLCNLWGISPCDLLDIVVWYCPELDETMWWRKTITSAEATLMLPPLHLYTAPPPPWEEHHHHHCPQKCWTSWHILSPHQISGSVRGRITARRGISSRISSGWIPAGAPAPTAGLVLPPSQLWLCGCIVRAQPHPHPPIHTRDQHYPGPRPGQQSWLFWSCQNKPARKKKNSLPPARRLLRLRKQQLWLDSFFYFWGGRVREELDNANEDKDQPQLRAHDHCSTLPTTHFSHLTRPIMGWFWKYHQRWR